MLWSSQWPGEWNPTGAGAEGPPYSHPGIRTPASALLPPGWGRGGSWLWEKLQSLPPLPTPLERASSAKGDSKTCRPGFTCVGRLGKSVDTVGEWGRDRASGTFFVQASGGGGLGSRRQWGRCGPSTAASRGQGGPPHAARHRASVSPDPRGTGQRPRTTFFLREKVPNNLGAESSRGRRPRAGGGAVRVALFTREAEEARPAGRWRRRGRGRPGGAGAAATARARLLLQAGRRSARRRAAAGPRGPEVGAGEGTRESADGDGRAGGGTCCSEPCAPGRQPLFSSWRSRRRRAAPRRSHARPLQTDGAVSGPRPGPAARQPARGPAHKGARALPRSLRSRYSAASSRISREFSSILRPARARAPGRRRPLPGPLRPAPLAARPARPAAPLPRLPRAPSALSRHPPLRALKLTLEGERRPAQPMGGGTRASGAGAGPGRDQWEPAERLGLGREC